MNTKTTTRTLNDVGVWLPQYTSPHGLRPDATDEEFASTVSLSESDMSEHGWTKVGTAVATVTLFSEKEITTNKLTSLQTELRSVRAAAEKKCNAILEQINKLQALEYTPGETA